VLLVRAAVGKAITGRDALQAHAGLFELERIGRQAELQVRCAVEIGPDVLQVLLEVPSVKGTAASLIRRLARRARANGRGGAFLLGSSFQSAYEAQSTWT
jgi:hypothetical protein